jgi:hypothetical protein
MRDSPFYPFGILLRPSLARLWKAHHQPSSVRSALARPRMVRCRRSPPPPRTLGMYNDKAVTKMKMKEGESHQCSAIGLWREENMTGPWVRTQHTACLRRDPQPPVNSKMLKSAALPQKTRMQGCLRRINYRCIATCQWTRAPVLSCPHPSHSELFVDECGRHLHSDYVAAQTAEASPTLLAVCCARRPRRLLLLLLTAPRQQLHAAPTPLVLEHLGASHGPAAKDESGALEAGPSPAAPQGVLQAS